MPANIEQAYLTDRDTRWFGRKSRSLIVRSFYTNLVPVSVTLEKTIISYSGFTFCTLQWDPPSQFTPIIIIIIHP